MVCFDCGRSMEYTRIQMLHWLKFKAILDMIDSVIGSLPTFLVGAAPGEGHGWRSAHERGEEITLLISRKRMAGEVREGNPQLRPVDVREERVLCGSARKDISLQAEKEQVAGRYAAGPGHIEDLNPGASPSHPAPSSSCGGLQESAELVSGRLEVSG